MAKQLLLTINLLLIYYDWLTLLEIAIVVFVLISWGAFDKYNREETKLVLIFLNM